MESDKPWGYKAINILILILLLSGCDYFKSEQTRFEEARAQYETGNYNTAAIELKKILRSNEQNIKARILLGKIQLWLGQNRQAESQFTKAIEYGAPPAEIAVPMAKAFLAVGKFPHLLNEVPLDSLPDPISKAELLVLRGKAYKALSDSIRAKAEFEKALERVPEFAQAYLGLAEMALADGDYEQTKILTGRVKTGDAAYPDALLLEARMLMEQARYADAETVFMKLLDGEQPALTPIQEFRGRTGLAESQFRQGKMDVAIKSVTALEKKYPGHPMPKYMAALVEYAGGNYAKAVSNLQSILQIAPDYPAAQFLMGASNYALNNLEQASLYLSKAVDIEPDNKQAQKLLAMTYMRLNEPDKATELLRHNLRLEGEGGNSDVLMMLGKASLQSGNVDVGLDYIEQSVESSGGNAVDLQMELAAAYIASGKPDLGVGILNKLPDNDEHGYRKGLLEILASVEKQEIDEAQVRAGMLLEKHPKDVAALSLAGSVSILAGKLTEAEYFFERALNIAPDDTGALINMGRLSLMQGNASGAKRWFQQALEKAPGESLALMALAGIAESEQRYEETERLLLEARRANPGNIEVDLAALRFYLSRKNYVKAREFALSVLKQEPNKPEAVSGLAAALLGQNKIAEAEKILEDTIQADNDSALLRYNLARIQLQSGKPEAAKAQLEQARILAPDSFMLATQLAVVETRLGNYERAFSIINEAKAHTPDSFQLLVLEGDVLMQQKRYDRAASVYEKAAMLKPSTELLVKLYAARKTAGMPRPETQLTDWLERHPDDVRIRAVLAEHYQANEDTSAAIKQYERIIATMPENVLALNNLAWLYHLTGNPQAVEIAEKAHRLRPETGEIADTLGWILVERNKLDRGVDLLREAVGKAPEVPEIKYHLAAGLYRQGGAADAKAILAELLADDLPFSERDAAQELYQTLQ